MTKIPLLSEGDVIELLVGHRVSVLLPRHCLYANHFGNFAEASWGEVTIGETLNGLDTSFLVGRYIVVQTAFTGGGVAMANDVYPDGHQVTAQRSMPVERMSKEHPLRVKFYQTGSFTTLIKNIVPVGRALAEWKEVTAQEGL